MKPFYDYPNCPLHGYSHFDEDVDAKRFYEFEDFADLIMLVDLASMSPGYLYLYGSNDSVGYYINRVAYTQIQLQRSLPGDGDDNYYDITAFSNIVPGLSVERPMHNKNVEWPWYLDKDQMKSDPVIHQGIGWESSGLGLEFPITPLWKKARDRLSRVLGEF